MKTVKQEEIKATRFAADMDCMAMLCSGVPCLESDWHEFTRVYLKDKSLCQICVEEYEQALSASDSAAWIDFQVGRKMLTFPRAFNVEHKTIWPQVSEFSLSDQKIQTQNLFAQTLYARLLHFSQTGEYPMLFRIKGMPNRVGEAVVARQAAHVIGG